MLYDNAQLARVRVHPAVTTCSWRKRQLPSNAADAVGGIAKVLTSWNGLMLAAFTNNLRYVDIAHQTLDQMQPMMSRYPLGFGQWLQALAYALSKPREIAIVGDPDSVDTQALLSVVRHGCRPFQVVAIGEPDINDMQLAQARQLPSNAADPVGCIAAVPLLWGRGLVEGQGAAYVCDAPVPGRALACQAPAADPDGLRALLGRQEAGFRASDEL